MNVYTYVRTAAHEYIIEAEVDEALLYIGVVEPGVDPFFCIEGSDVTELMDIFVHRHYDVISVMATEVEQVIGRG